MSTQPQNNGMAPKLICSYHPINANDKQMPELSYFTLYRHLNWNSLECLTSCNTNTINTSRKKNIALKVASLLFNGISSYFPTMFKFHCLIHGVFFGFECAFSNCNSSLIMQHSLLHSTR